MSELSRRGFIGLGAGAAALAMAGCSDFSSSSTSGSSSDSLVFRWWGGTARNTAYESALKVFTQKTGIKVTAQYSGYDGYFDKLDTEFAGGNPPDVFQMDTALTSTYAAKGVLTSLSSYIPGTIALDTLFTQLQSAGVVKGVNYGIASGSGYAPVLYNETVLNKLKISYPENSWTWDDFATITNEVAKGWGSGKYGAMDASGDDSGRCSRGCASAARTCTRRTSSSASTRTTSASGGTTGPACARPAPAARRTWWPTTATPTPPTPSCPAPWR